MTEPGSVEDRLSAHRRGLRYADLAIGVACPEPSYLVWLEEFLAPAFEPTAAEGCDRWVVLDLDASRHAATLARGPSPDAVPVPCFVLDGGTVCHPEWNGSGPDERILFDAHYQAFYCVERRSGHVRILATPRPNLTRIALMRVVRELAMAASLARGGLLLHGAAFAIGGRGVVLAGPRRAGKSTLLLHALQAAGALFISNDRVLARQDQGHVVLRGMPTIVNLRPGTLAMFPAVSSRIRARGYHPARTLAQASRPGARPRVPRPDGAVTLTPLQFCEAAQVGALPQAEAWRLVFPRVRESGVGIELDPLDPGTAARRLRAALFAAERPGQVAEAFAGPDGAADVGEAALQRRVLDLAARVPCYDAALGVEAYGGAGAADEFIARLAGPTPTVAGPRS